MQPSWRLEIVLLTISLLAVSACGASFRYMHHRNGVLANPDDYLRARAACEKEVGGTRYPTAVELCLKDAGWTLEKVYY